MAGKIVIVNDDALQRLLLASLLRKAGFVACTFECAERALQAMTYGGPPSLIITDISMPEIDGWRFCRLLRSPEYAALQRVPILVVSAIFAGEAPAQIAADLGAEAFLPSPINGSDFVETVKSLLAGRGAVHKYRVMIVEDDVHLAAVIRECFEAEGYLAGVAGSLDEARTLFQRNYYDIAIVDERLPDGSGSDLLQEGAPQHSGCAFIMMSGLSSPGRQLGWMKAGASACISKPFEMDYLLACSERARRERALVRSEEMLAIRTQQRVRREAEYSSLVAGIPDAVMRFDREKRCLFASTNTEVLLGMPDVSGKPIVDMGLPSALVAVWEQALEKVFTDGEPCECEFVLDHPNRGQRVFAWRLLPEFEDLPTSVAAPTPAKENRRVRTVITFAQDITTRKAEADAQARLQQQFLQAQKMQTVGRLAGGVAHYFNNMLCVILGNIELAQDLVMDHPDACRFLEAAYDAGMRSAATTRQLLAFTRQQPIVPVDLDLNQQIFRNLPMLRRILGDHIALTWEPADRLCHVYFDPNQIDEVLVNLCFNARDAIHHPEGSITIRTAYCAWDTAFCASHSGCVPGNYASLVVRDTGCGMPPEVLARVFEPFFTTKELGLGIGLGLSTVYGIIQQNQGHIAIASEVGQGTTVSIFLPCAEQRHATCVPSAEQDLGTDVAHHVTTQHEIWSTHYDASARN